MNTCNQLLDGIARCLFNEPFDQGGRLAAHGEVDLAIRNRLTDILHSQADLNRSLGTGDELGRWVEQQRNENRIEDIARSACEAIAIVIASTVKRKAVECGIGPLGRILLAGGGVLNQVLYNALTQQLGTTVQLTDEYGVSAQYREAAAIAVLGALCQDRVPITIPEITGVRDPAPVAGVWIHPSTDRKLVSREASVN